MYILGISSSMHDSAVSLIQNGKVVAAIEEERLNRQKHTGTFPHKALEYVIDKYINDINIISYIGFNFRPGIVLNDMLNKYCLTNFPGEFNLFYMMHFWYENLKKQTDRVLKKKYNYKGKILFIEHHAAHAASAYFCSPFNEALIMSVDGTGEKNTFTLWHGKDNHLKLLKSNDYPHSLGVLYSMITYHIGLGFFGEGKTMGLSSYGKDRYKSFFDTLVLDDPGGLFQLNPEYINLPGGSLILDKALTPEALKILGPPRAEKDEILQRHMDIACSLQNMIERWLVRIADKYMEKTDCSNICLAGGVALNSVANEKIRCLERCRRIFIQPAAGDGGTALGAGLYIHHELLEGKKTQASFTPYLGPCYGNNEIETILKQNKYHYKISTNIEKETAELIARDKIIGWFQGPMEFGPRALGNRSILANPCNPDMKDILNSKVKFREHFRPFAPAVIEEQIQDYFDLDCTSEHMLLVCNVKNKKAIPAVTHVDGTGRIQTVSKQSNSKFWKLITEFGKITGVPVVLNTSFNIKGDPIVCSPEDALECFFKTNIDYLIMGDYILEKSGSVVPPPVKEESKKRKISLKKRFLHKLKKSLLYGKYILSGIFRKIIHKKGIPDQEKSKFIDGRL